MTNDERDIQRKRKGLQHTEKIGSRLGVVPVVRCPPKTGH